MKFFISIIFIFVFVGCGEINPQFDFNQSSNSGDSLLSLNQQDIKVTSLSDMLTFSGSCDPSVNGIYWNFDPVNTDWDSPTFNIGVQSAPPPDLDCSDGQFYFEVDGVYRLFQSMVPGDREVIEFMAVTHNGDTSAVIKVDITYAGP